MDFYEEMIRKTEDLRKKDVVRILAIETSCDETSVAIVENGRTVLSNIVASQIDIHKRFGGVVPEVASRNHILSIVPLIDEALKSANITLNDIDAVGVTQGAGLVGALLVGLTTAKALSFALNVPLIAVNHIKGHIAANYIAHPDLEPPFVCLIVSGGHTALVKVTDYGKFELIGTTQDDAIGEAYDKVARVLGLGYPGGPAVDRMSKGARPDITFVKHETLKNTYDMSYSGLKTAVINYINQKKQKGEELDVPTICASFQEQAVGMVVSRAIRACKESNIDTLVIGGGVAANSYLREKLTRQGHECGITVKYPPISLCTDNAAMIGSLAYYNLLIDNPAELTVSALASVPLE